MAPGRQHKLHAPSPPSAAHELLYVCILFCVIIRAGTKVEFYPLKLLARIPPKL